MTLVRNARKLTIEKNHHHSLRDPITRITEKSRASELYRVSVCTALLGQCNIAVIENYGQTTSIPPQCEMRTTGSAQQIVLQREG